MQNAIQAGEGSDGPVRVTITREGEMAAIAIHNKGTAIPEDAREHLFEPFFTTKQKGTGLGLAFVSEIAKDHGGTITCTSDAEAGTCFTLTLPVAPSQPVETPQPDKSSS